MINSYADLVHPDCDVKERDLLDWKTGGCVIKPHDWIDDGAENYYEALMMFKCREYDDETYEAELISCIWIKPAEDEGFVTRSDFGNLESLINKHLLDGKSQLHKYIWENLR